MRESLIKDADRESFSEVSHPLKGQLLKNLAQTLPTALFIAPPAICFMLMLAILATEPVLEHFTEIEDLSPFNLEPGELGFSVGSLALIGVSLVGLCVNELYFKTSARSSGTWTDDQKHGQFKRNNKLFYGISAAASLCLLGAVAWTLGEHVGEVDLDNRTERGFLSLYAITGAAACASMVTSFLSRKQWSKMGKEDKLI